MVSDITRGNNIEDKTAKVIRRVRRIRRMIRLVLRFISATLWVVGMSVCDLVRHAVECVRHIRLERVHAVFLRCWSRCGAWFAMRLAACKSWQWLKAKKSGMHMITREELRIFGRKQLLTVCSYSAVTLAVVLSGIASPAASIRSSFLQVASMAGIQEEQAVISTDTGDAAPSAQHRLQSAMPSAAGAEIAIPVACNVNLQIGLEKTVTVKADTEMTVQTVLKNAGVTVGADDILSPGANEKVSQNLTIKLTRVTYSAPLQRSEALAFQTEVTYVQDIPKGETRQLSYGRDGWHIATVRNRYENGAFAGEEMLDEVITQQPVNAQILEGSGGIYTDAQGNSYSYSYYIDVMATAYGSYNSRTATGKVPMENYIAVDPSVISLGTAVYVAGDTLNAYDGVYYAEDTGGNIQGDRIDIYMGSMIYDLEEMLQFGVRDMRVYILE